VQLRVLQAGGRRRIFAMGDEMNRASKLGEDTARGAETLVTGSFFEVARARTDVVFEPLAQDDMLFPYYRASRRR
jgi:hypothetical protein